MDIFTEQGTTYEECIAKIHTKYGSNIHILRQKNVKKGGFLGIFEKEVIEISFTILRNPYKYTVPTTSRKLDFDEEKKKILNQMNPSLSVEAFPGEKNETKSLKDASLNQEQLQNILKVVQNLEKNLQPRDSVNSNDEHETIQKIEKILELNDFTNSYTRKILSRLRSEFSLEELSRFDSIQDIVIEWIGQSIDIFQNEPAVRPRIIVLVGPTGVGKTTTIAKLAAAYSLDSGSEGRPLKVRILTIDNYRIGAKQQIEIYGTIMKIPVSYAEKPSDLASYIASNLDADIILIDTIGKSPKDYTKIAEMRQFLDAAGTISDMHLAVSATTKASDMVEIFRQYETFGYSSLIITKFDETTKVGNIISVLSEQQKKIAYITTGQRVPQDFEQASVVRLLTHLEGFRINRSRIDELFPISEFRFKWR